ncbi:MAG: T9SS type A sorting domain-containing protein [Chitinophagales bacterium]|nr:T9SS type A sorting domain-containing protein [Chitinophagales bacterium]
MITRFTLLVFILFCGNLAAHPTNTPPFFGKNSWYNTTVGKHFGGFEAPGDFDGDPEKKRFAAAKSVSRGRILFLNYSAYDSAYADKFQKLIAAYFPACTLSTFSEGSAEDLSAQLEGVQIVAVPYPSSGRSEVLRAYGKVLQGFVQKGGHVLFTGTHDAGVIQDYGLLELEKGYYCNDMQIQAIVPDHPMVSGMPTEFLVSDFAYPLDVSDTAFVSLAEIGGFPVLGYKQSGLGKVVYLGLEYYYAKQATTMQIAIQTMGWLLSTCNPESDRPVRRVEEVYRTGGSVRYDLKIYPNPYMTKATLDLDLSQAAYVSVQMTEETGRSVINITSPRQLQNGFYHFDLPNVAPGVYFLQINIDDKKVVRKVVKSAAQ